MRKEYDLANAHYPGGHAKLLLLPCQHPLTNNTAGVQRIVKLMSIVETHQPTFDKDPNEWHPTDPNNVLAKKLKEDLDIDKGISTLFVSHARQDIRYFTSPRHVYIWLHCLLEHVMAQAAIAGNAEMPPPNPTNWPQSNPIIVITRQTNAAPAGSAQAPAAVPASMQAPALPTGSTPDTPEEGSRARDRSRSKDRIAKKAQAEAGATAAAQENVRAAEALLQMERDGLDSFDASGDNAQAGAEAEEARRKVQRTSGGDGNAMAVDQIPGKTNNARHGTSYPFRHTYLCSQRSSN